jgi:hypothetical protein
MTRESYLKRIREGLDLVTGHFRSIWYIDHLQFQDVLVLEGWAALTCMAACFEQAWRLVPLPSLFRVKRYAGVLFKGPPRDASCQPHASCN